MPVSPSCVSGASPLTWKRRSTPAYWESPSAMVLNGTPSSSPTATAASALRTLCRPGACSVMPPSRSVPSNTSNCVVAATCSMFSARSDAWRLVP